MGPDARLRLTQGSDEVQHLSSVPAGIDTVEHVPHGALLVDDESGARDTGFSGSVGFLLVHHAVFPAHLALGVRDRKSTRLNSSHGYISYAVFCLKKKKNKY